MHCHSGFFAIFGTIKQQGVKSFQGILPLDPYQGPALDPLEGAYSVHLRVGMTFGHSMAMVIAYIAFGHYGSYLRLQRELLQKRRESPSTSTNFKGFTVTISLPPVMGRIFSGNFLIVSFSQETLCQKWRRTLCKWKDEGTASQPMQVHERTSFWKSLVGVKQKKWPVR